MKRYILIVALFLAFVTPVWAHHRSLAGDPTANSDCGAGTVLSGNETAMRLTNITPFNTCTIAFPDSANRVCSAMDEGGPNTGGGPAFAMGCVEIDATTIQLTSMNAILAGDVITVMVGTYP